MERFIVSETNSLDVGSVSSLVDTSDKKDTNNQTTYTVKALRKGGKFTRLAYTIFRGVI